MNKIKDLGEAERDLGEPSLAELERNSIFIEGYVYYSFVNYSLFHFITNTLSKHKINDSIIL